MRQLHVVAVSDDGRQLVLAATPEAVGGGFRVSIDDRLRAALRGDLGRPGARDVRVESALSPRQIQARLRSGDSAEEVARAAGVPLTRVERYAGPILSERAQVLEEAHAAVLSRARRGPSALPLGAAVGIALGGLAGLRPESVAWGAGRRDDGTWTVTLTYSARGRTKTVRWLWRPSERVITAIDPTASALGHVDPADLRRPTQSRSSAKPAEPTSPPQPAARPVPKSTVRRRAKPVPTLPVARKRPATTPPVATARRPAAGKPGRASVPAWADILLGSASVDAGAPPELDQPASTNGARRRRPAGGSPPQR